MGINPLRPHIDQINTEVAGVMSKLGFPRDPEVEVDLCIAKIAAAHELLKGALEAACQFVVPDTRTPLVSEAFLDPQLSTRARTIVGRIIDASNPNNTDYKSNGYRDFTAPIYSVGELKKTILSKQDSLRKIRTCGEKTFKEITDWASTTD